MVPAGKFIPYQRPRNEGPLICSIPIGPSSSASLMCHPGQFGQFNVVRFANTTGDAHGGDLPPVWINQWSLTDGYFLRARNVIADIFFLDSRSCLERFVR